MHKAILTLNHGARSLARHLRDWLHETRQWRWFWSCYREYVRSCKQQAGDEPRPSPKHLLPCLTDATTDTHLEPVYFYQGCWAFERIIAQRPAWHVDVASQAFFVALLSKVVPVTMIDIRPLSLPMPSLQFRKGSVLSLPYADGEVPSVSSICVIEHIGLGRYGDPIDASGTEKALAELKRIVQPGGNLYLSVPLDDCRRTYFNAHRAFTESYLFQHFAPFEIVNQRYIWGNNFQDTIGQGFGIGCYHLRRPGGVGS